MVKLGLVLAAILIVLQLVPVERSNPPVTGEIEVPERVRSVLERSCYDCHSNETRWPWYSRVAPVSFLLAHDVAEAREHMNFSTWASLDADEQDELRHEIWEEVEEGEMPLWFYLPLHPEARLSEADHAVLERWSTGGGSDPTSASGR